MALLTDARKRPPVHEAQQDDIEGAAKQRNQFDLIGALPDAKCSCRDQIATASCPVPERSPPSSHCQPLEHYQGQAHLPRTLYAEVAGRHRA